MRDAERAARAAGGDDRPRRPFKPRDPITGGPDPQPDPKPATAPAAAAPSTSGAMRMLTGRTLDEDFAICAAAQGITAEQFQAELDRRQSG